MPETSPDITVIGAGAIGASCAWRLAQTGRKVVLVDDPNAAPASSVAAGMLAPVTEAGFGEEAVLRFNLASADLYPSFVEELDETTSIDVGYRRCGTLMVARDHDDNRVLEELYGFQIRLGLDARRLSGREARDLEPALSPRTRGGIVVEGDHQVDPAALLRSLRAACEIAGVRSVLGRAVEIGDGSVVLEDGRRMSSETVVLAAGSYSGRISGSGWAVPVRPVKGQLVHLRARGGAPISTRNVRGLDVYVVSRSDGRIVIGASVEEQGFDVTLTAGAVHDLLRYAYEILPGITEMEYVGVTAGLRPATPDNAPVIGELAAGVLVATGHYRNGVLLAPATARAVVGFVEGRQSDQLVAPFTPRRFSRSLLQP